MVLRIDGHRAVGLRPRERRHTLGELLLHEEDDALDTRFVLKQALEDRGGYIEGDIGDDYAWIRPKGFIQERGEVQLEEILINDADVGLVGQRLAQDGFKQTV